jgi:hypothetical protein
MATRDKGPEPIVPDPDAPPSEEELAESARLREALEDPSKAHEGADLARAFALAHEPRPLGADEHGEIVARAVRHVRPRAKIVRVAFRVGVPTALALAAGIILLIKTRGPLPVGPVPGVAPAALAVARSSQPLFKEPFAPVGGESARIDRILLARAGDLRRNEFTRWGVR